MQICFPLSTFLDFFTWIFGLLSRRKCSFQKKKITTVNSFFHYDDIRLLYERIQYLQLHNTFFSINHCWVVNNMDAGKISICNNWIRKWSGAEETIFDLAIFLCIRRRYSLLLSHACIIHIRLLNNGEWSDYTMYQYFCWHTQLQIIKKLAKFSQDIYKFGNFAIIAKRCFVRFLPQ